MSLHTSVSAAQQGSRGVDGLRKQVKDDDAEKDSVLLSRFSGQLVACQAARSSEFAAVESLNLTEEDFS